MQSMAVVPSCQEPKPSGINGITKETLIMQKHHGHNTTNEYSAACGRTVYKVELDIERQKNTASVKLLESLTSKCQKHSRGATFRGRYRLAKPHHQCQQRWQQGLDFGCLALMSWKDYVI